VERDRTWDEIVRLRERVHTLSKTCDGLHWRVQALERVGVHRRSNLVFVAEIIVAVCAVTALILPLVR
jgi:hypothetical protein